MYVYMCTHTNCNTHTHTKSNTHISWVAGHVSIGDAIVAVDGCNITMAGSNGWLQCLTTLLDRPSILSGVRVDNSRVL